MAIQIPRYLYCLFVLDYLTKNLNNCLLNNKPDFLPLND